MLCTRREFLRGAVAVSAMAGFGRFAVAEAKALPTSGADAPLFAQLDRYAEQFLRESNSPGMTLVLADQGAVRRVVTYGFSDLQRQQGIRADELFQIGSISKSFVALCLLQLHREGRLDLHKPVKHYLPWLKVESKYAPITTHHLLTHTSGLPAFSNIFLTEPGQAHHAAYPPGERFYYNNMAYSILGHLAWTLDGRSLPELLRARVLEPLGMTQSEPAIDLDMSGRLVRSYTALQSDRPHSRHGPLTEAPGMIYASGAGCVSATARDMGAYLRMLLNRGAGPNGALLTKEDFALFTTGYIVDPTESDARYAYGLYTDQFDGNTMLFHTGGMTSFVSSLMVDMDAGVGAFAALNALDRAPTPVVRYAIQLLRAQREGRRFPAMPASPPPTWQVDNAKDYAGIYRDRDGEQREVVADGPRLYLLHAGARVVLERTSGDKFLPLHPELNRFVMVFGREGVADGPVTELGWGDRWYTSAGYRGPKEFTYPPEWDAYVGHYCDMGTRIRSTRVVIRKGQLLMNGVTALELVGDKFVTAGKEPSPEWIRFGDVINGCCMWMNATGRIISRVPVA